LKHALGEIERDHRIALRKQRSCGASAATEIEHGATCRRNEPGQQVVRHRALQAGRAIVSRGGATERSGYRLLRA
jgi:hypothetical protein